MLTHLRIARFALIDELELSLGPGLTVLTGETGAGKSLIVDAVALLRGGRASADVVRGGEGEARVEAELDVPTDSPAVARLRRAGFLPDAADGSEAGVESGSGPITIVVRRTVNAGGSAGGRGRAYINGQLASAALLGEILGSVVELAGQHEHQGLTDPTSHLALLDGFGVPAERIAAVRELDERLAKLAESLNAIFTDERARAEREDFLRFQLREIDDLSPRAGEDAELLAERQRLRHAEQLRATCSQGEESLYAGEGAVVDRLAALRRELEAASAIDGALGPVARNLEEARALCEDAADTLRRYTARLSADPERLAHIEERLDALGRLLRKHGPRVEEILRRRDEMASELETLTQAEARRGTLQQEIEATRDRTAVAATALSEARRTAARQLAERAEAELAELGMEGARVAVEVAPRLAREDDDAVRTFGDRRLGPNGWDRAEILFSANRGEPMRPLARTASGGELSRVMLALKQALSRADAVRTYVFDEVDAGVGGAIAEVIGRKLRRIAIGRQVLCVTHLPQIAACADAHVRIEKETAGGRTVSSARPLSVDERREEIARMLGGLTVTGTTRAHAAEMLEKAAELGAGTPRRKTRDRRG